MPARKKKKKKKADKSQDPQLDFDLYFDDVTILESDGKYERVKELMEEDLQGVWGENHGCVKSGLTIFSAFGQGNLTIDFHYDGRVFIVGFMSSNMSVSMNMDVRCLSMWCQENGWQVPQVSPAVAQEDTRFWKHWWESRIIDSDYFTERFGPRSVLDMSNAAEGEPEETEIK